VTNLTLLAAWSAIGLGAAATDGSYSLGSVTVLAVGVLFVVVAVGRSRRPAGDEHGALSGSTLAAAAAVAAAAVLPAGIYGSGPALYLSRSLTVVAALGVLTWLVLRLPGARTFAYVVVGVMAAAGVALLISSRHPTIDTWVMLQAATHGLSHGHDIYTVRFTTHYVNRVSNHFTYLPGSAVALWPFNAVLGDVRYGLLAAMVLTALILIRLSRSSDGALVASLFVLYPRLLFGLEQSWADPLSLLGLCVTGWAVVRNRRGWAMVAFAFVLVCKPYNWMLLPLAALWKDFGWRRSAASAGGALAFMSPWMAANFHAFVSGAITLNLDLPLRLDSDSLYTTIVLHGHNPGAWLPAVVVLVAIAVAAWRLRRDAFGFFTGAALAVACFDLFDRLSFFNEWEFAAGLVLAAVIFGQVSTTVREPTEARTGVVAVGV